MADGPMKPNIVILANNIEELGGAQRIGHQLAQGLAARGYPVDLVGLAAKPPVHVYRDHPAYSAQTLLPEPLAPVRDAARREEQRRQIRSRLTAVLTAQEPGIVITAQVWAREHLHAPVGWRVIGQYHSSYQAAVASGDLERLVREYRDVDWFCALTEEDASHFARHDLNNMRVMVNPVDPWPTEPAALVNPVVTVLGRLSWEKAPDIALAAWAQIAEEFPDWRLQFVGHGPMGEEIARTQVPRVLVAESTGDPGAVLSETSVLLLPSVVEGSPMSVLEAMSWGIPVVAADCSAGVRALVHTGVTGRLAIRGNVDSLAAQLRIVLASAQARQEYGAQARAHAAAFRLEPVLDSWEWLIQQTLR
jgi:glycosyltransferase involved in cell wall biosynthesis